MTRAAPPAPARHRTTVRAGSTLAAGAALTAGGLTLIGGIVTPGLAPWLAVTAALGTAVATWCAVTQPVAMLMIVVVAEVVNLAGAAAGLGVPGLFQALLALAVVALASVLREEEARRRIGPPAWWCVALLATYLASQAVSIVVTTDLPATVSAIDRRAVDCLVVVVVLLLTVATDSGWRVAAAVVAPLALLSALSVVNLLMTGGTTDMLGFSEVTQASGELTTTVRFGGPLPDSNFWGRHLVVGPALAVALALRAHRQHRPVWTATWVATAALLPVGMYLTQSRGTYLAAAVGIVVFLALADRTVRLGGLWLVPAVAGLALLPGVGNRFVSLVADLTSDASTGVDPSILGRSAAQEIAWQMFAERPLTGYGLGSYAGLVPAYADRVPTSVAHPTDATHNLYAELAAETGVLGLLGWAVLVLGVGGLVAHRAMRTGDVQLRRFAAAVVAALVAWSAASVFLHLAYFRTFGLLVVLAAAVCSVADPVPRPGIGPGAARELARAAAVLAVAAVAAVGAGWELSRDEAQASAQLVVVPRGTPGQMSAWPMDVRSRQIVMPTLAALFESGTPGTRFIGDPVRGLVTVHVTADDPDAALATLAAAPASARHRLEVFGVTSTFRVEALGTPEVTQTRQLTPVALTASAAVGAGVLVLGWLATRRQSGARQFSPPSPPTPAPASAQGPGPGPGTASTPRSTP